MVSIDSEKVTEIDELTETEVSPSDGEVEDTLGGVVSGVVVSLSDEFEDVSYLVSSCPQDV